MEQECKMEVSINRQFWWLLILALAAVGCNSKSEPDGYDSIKQHIDQCMLPNYCLLEYNGALTEGDPCCLAVGGQNTCDRNIECNDAAGENCCLIYSTNHTAIEQGCCLYADGTVDDPQVAQACDALLNFGGVPDSTEFCPDLEPTDLPISPEATSSDCLIEYNEGLVAPGEDPCCFRKGGVNTCDLSVLCNDLTDEQCCLFYATEFTEGGQGCCLYGHDETPLSADGTDRTEECAALLYLRQEHEMVQQLEDQCPRYSGCKIVKRVGALDSALTMHDLFTDEIPEISSSGTVVVVFQLASEWIPQTIDFASDDPQAAIKAFSKSATESYGQSRRPDDLEWRIDIHAELLSEGWLWIETNDVIPGGAFVQINLDYDKLFPNTGWANQGFALYFHII